MGQVECTVFIVEDDPNARTSFAALGSTLGYCVESYPSAEDLLQVVDATRPGCVVVDYRLEGIDGIELHRQLLQKGIQLPVILISGVLSVRAATAAVEQGVFRVLEKPYKGDELTHAIQDAIRHDHQSRIRKWYRMDFEHRLESLDARERLTLDLIVAGHSGKTIERRLGLSRRTIDRIRSSILDKMKSLSFVELSAALGEARVAGRQPAFAGLGSTQAATPPSTAEGLESALGELNESNWRWLCCDLHDGAAQYLSAALMRLQALQTQFQVPEAAQASLNEAQSLLSVALRDIRDIISGRSPTCSTQSGIIPSLKRLVRRIVGSEPIEVEFEENLGQEKLEPLLEAAIYRVLQESLHNALRHSASKRLRVQLSRADRTLKLEIRDWGKGFKSDDIAADRRGLRGIRERVELLGGQVLIRSAVGLGTIVSAEFPVRTPQPTPPVKSSPVPLLAESGFAALTGNGSMAVL